MWRFVRILVSGFIAIETFFGTVSNGVSSKDVTMPEVTTGEYTQFVDLFTQAFQSIGQLLSIHYPITQRAVIFITLAKPAVVENH